MKFKKLAAIAVAGVAALSLGACGVKQSGGGTGTAGALKSAQDVYGMGAVTTVQLLGSSFSASAVKALSAVRLLDEPEVPTNPDAPVEPEVPTNPDTPAEPEVPVNPDAPGESGRPDDEIIKEFHKYFEMLDTLLGDDVINTAVTDNTDEAYADYSKKMEISGLGLDGKKVTHVMYYNETQIEGRDKTDDDEESDKGGKTETEYALEGVMILDGQDYAMKGERTEEIKKDESQSEISLRAYPDKSVSDTYVEVKQESETEEGESETEYVYRVFDAGKLIEETAVAFETENEEGESETEIRIDFRQGKGKGSYRLSKETEGGETEIAVKYVTNEKQGNFKIEMSLDKDGNPVYEYEFEGGDKIQLEDDDD